MHKLVYLCDWLPPDFGAVGQYSVLFARERAAAGQDVVLAGLSSRADGIEEECVEAGRLRTVRLATPSYDRANFRGRALWTLRTNFRLLWRLAPELRRTDEILFTGSPPFLIHFLVPANLIWRKKLTYRITDFHPECLMAELPKVPSWLRAFHRLTVALRKRVHGFEVLGEDQRRRLLDLGIPDARIRVRRDPAPVSIPADCPPLPHPGELAGRTLLLYSGNFGVAHDDATFIEGYRRHHQEGSARVALWLNATGARADRVEAALRAAELPIHRGHPVPLAELARLLVTPTAHLITLRDEFVGYVLPSKVHACIESGRQILFIGSAESDVDWLCRERMPQAEYRRVPVGDPTGVASALEAIADSVSFAAFPSTERPKMAASRR